MCKGIDVRCVTEDSQCIYIHMYVYVYVSVYVYGAWFAMVWFGSVTQARVHNAMEGD